MTKSPNQDERSNPPVHKRLWLLLLSRGGLVLGGVLLLGVVGGVWRLWNFVQKELTPLAQSNLTNTLNRPVKLGGVTDFSLTGVRFGASAIPATATDPDRVTIDAVEVGFDPLQLIFNRRLKLDVTLVNPDIYIEKDNQGRWITTTIAPPGKDGLIKTDLEKLRLRNGKLVLVPQASGGSATEGQGAGVASNDNSPSSSSSPSSPPSPPSSLTTVEFSQLNGTAEIRDNNQLIQFDVTGRADDGGGNVAVRGEAQVKTQAANLQIKGQDLLAADITHLIKLPLNLQAGRVNGDLQVRLLPQQQPLLYGNADVQGVTVQIPRVPQLLSNTQGHLGFQGMEIKLENITTNYGKIPVVAQGIVDRKTGFKLTGRVNGVSIPTALDSLKVKLPVSAVGEVKADLQILGSLTKPMLVGSVATTKTAKIDKVDFKSLTSKFELTTSNSLITLKDIQGTPVVGGEVVGGGTIKLGKPTQLNFNFTANNLPGNAIAKIYDPNSTLQIGTVAAKGQLTGVPGDVQTVVQWQAPEAIYPASGTIAIAPDRTVNFRDVALKVGGGSVLASGSYANQRWQAVAEASGVQLAAFVKQDKLQNVSLNGAEFNGRLRLSGTTSPFKLSSIRPEGAAVQIAGGTVTVANLQLQDQNFTAQLVANGLRLGRILKKSPTPILNNPLAGTFQIAGKTNNFNIKTLTATGEARLSVGNGAVTATNIQLADGRYQAQVKANNVPLGQLAAVPPQFQGALAGDFNVAGSAESFQPQTIQASGQGRLNIAGGTITASNIQVAQGRYQAVVDAAGVQLNRLNEQLRGAFGGKLQVAGNVGTAKLADVRATGQVKLSQGISVIDQPLSAAIAWNGDRLIVERATASNLNASGYILANAQKVGVPEITGLNLNVQAQDFNLQNLPFKLPNGVNLAGRADFGGQITGTLPVPDLRGQLRLRGLVVRDLAFEPVLSGNIESVRGKGVNLNVAGNSDRLAVNLDANNRPKSFLAKWQQATAIGQAQGDNLALNLENFPLRVLNLTLPANTRLGGGALAGDLSGNLVVNQRTFAASGNLAIARPEIGRIKGDRLAAEFRYGNGVATLTNSEFIKGESRYAFVGSASQSSKGPQLQGKLNISSGKVQDVLTTLQVFELQDVQPGLAAPTYGKAADLTTNAQGLPGQSLLNQIERLSQIDTLVAQEEQKRRDATPVPELADLQGTFNGEIALNTATPNGLAANFKLNGQNWSWGKDQEKDEPGRYYEAKRVIAEGSFANGVLQLLPLRIESENGLIAFQGNVGGNEQTGNLQVENFPIQALSNFVKLPIGITGNLNAKAALAGSIKNPKAKGELQITDGTINQKKLESATASFSYDNGRLNFGSKVTAAGPEPVDINGSIPVATTSPDTDPISLDVKVKNEGLTLLNLLTNQVAFEKGEGEVDLTVRGTKKQPQVVGTATVNNATFTAQALPGKLRRVTGKVQFDLDRILVEKLEGRFSKGKVEAAGEIPIFNNAQATINNPLTVNLDQLALNLKGLYQGGASGNLQITGSALNPVIGGQVNLFDGQVLLAESTGTNQPTTNSLNVSFAKADKQNKGEGKNAVGSFNNLELSLGKNVQITRPPILSFIATGNLAVNGSFIDPIPNGTIRLQKGGVNLFTTQFNLVGGYTNTATFRANQPRDPELDIKLYAKVLDGIQTNDINRLNTTGLAGLETVRVEASIKGPASKLNENLELKSSPTRGETEIIALLGGGFVGTQGRGDSTLGLINIAGSAVFNNFQGAFNQIGNAFGLSELRLFPTVISQKPEAGRNNSTLELAVEAGIDISSKFSVSSIKILTANDPFQWGLNYRINDQFRIRASTNLADDSRAVIEYENRF